MGYTEKENQITFNSYDNNISTLHRKIGNEAYNNVTVDKLSTVAQFNNGKLPTTINAVEIDWNTAQLDKGININTTSELLTLINDMLKNFKTVEGNTLQLAIYKPDEKNQNEGTLVL